MEGRTQEEDPIVFWTGQVEHLNHQALRENRGKEHTEMVRVELEWKWLAL